MVVPDVALHVVQRGHDREPCFFGEHDYLAYLFALQQYAARFRCRIHAYCLMTNHVHLLLTPSDTVGCSQMMKHLAQRHSRRINAKRGRTGTLWESRFYSALVPDGHYALSCYRYIELNPVRAGLVGHPGNYRWSSYRSNVGSIADGWTSAHVAYLALSDQPPVRALAYRALFEAPLADGIMDDIRKATRSGGRVGQPRKPRGRPKRSGAEENRDCHQLEMVTVTI